MSIWKIDALNRDDPILFTIYKKAVVPISEAGYSMVRLESLKT